MDKNKRYYGVVVAHVYLMLKEEGQIEPIRQATNFYDEFIVVGGKMDIPINFWSAIIIIGGFLIGLVLFVKSYVFGDIYKFRDIREDIKNITESGINTYDILESDFEEKEEPVNKTKREDSNIMREMDDRTAPLDADL